MSDTFRLEIQTVQAAGRTAWLIEDQSVPVVSICWGWRGGAALEANEHAGALAMGAALLTEGAGPLDNLAFADALRDAAIGIDFDAQRDGFEASFRALRPALDEAVRLANLAMRSASAKALLSSGPAPSVSSAAPIASAPACGSLSSAAPPRQAQPMATTGPEWTTSSQAERSPSLTCWMSNWKAWVMRAPPAAPRRLRAAAIRSRRARGRAPRPRLPPPDRA